MKYTVKGAHRETGEELELVLDAASIEAASAKANSLGILVTSCIAIQGSMAQPMSGAQPVVAPPSPPLPGKTVAGKRSLGRSLIRVGTYVGAGLLGLLIAETVRYALTGKTKFPQVLAWFSEEPEVPALPSGCTVVLADTGTAPAVVLKYEASSDDGPRKHDDHSDWKCYWPTVTVIARGQRWHHRYEGAYPLCKRYPTLRIPLIGFADEDGNRFDPLAMRPQEVRVTWAAEGTVCIPVVKEQPSVLELFKSAPLSK